MSISSTSPSKKAWSVISGGSPSRPPRNAPSRFKRKQPPQKESLGELISYSEKLKRETEKAYLRKHYKEQSSLQTRLDSLVQAPDKDYFAIASTLYKLMANKERDLVTRLGAKKA